LSITPSPLLFAACLGQADNKLIAARCGTVLLAVDQHAAHERVQLEALQQQLAQQVNVTSSPSGAAAAAAARREDKAGGRVGSLLSHQLLQHPQQLNLTLQEACALQQYQPMVEAWGWRVSLTAAAAAAVAGEAAAGATTNAGITQPAVLQQVPVLAGITLGAVDLQVC
jgi:DNA mismatch repair ATPase MutL